MESTYPSSPIKNNIGCIEIIDLDVVADVFHDKK